MKPFLCGIMISVLALSVQAQSPVKKDVLKILGAIPPPPSTTAEAYSRCACDEGGTPCSAEKVFAAVAAELKEAEDMYKAQEATVRTAVPPGMNPEAARMAQDPEMKKKMKSMSKEERMKLALSMMNAGPSGTPAVQPDPPAVQSALTEWQKVSADVLPEFNRGVAAQDALRAAAEADQKAHNEIAQWEEESIAKLPTFSSGEMNYHDPAQVRAVRLKAAERHIALAEKRLTTARKEWPADRDRIQSRYGKFHGALIAADYAQASPNFSSRKILSDAQMTILKEIAVCVHRSRDAYENAAEWVAHKKAIEKE